MRLPKFLFILLISISANGQDSLRSKGLKLFDIQCSLGLGISNLPVENTSIVSQFTKHKEFVSDDFTRGYSDSLASRGFQEWFGPGLYSELGINSSFQFQRSKSKLLQRIKPRLGFYYRSQTLLDYELGYSKSYRKDTLYFVDPAYPPTYVDSTVSGQIRYRYSTKSIFFEAGANFDLIVTRRLILYAGLIVGCGMGYDNTFSVTKSENAYLNSSNGKEYELSSFEKKFKEQTTYTTRFVVPVGIQHRFAVFHKFSLGFFGEMRFGISTLKTKEGLSFSSDFFTMKGGLRFNFQYHK